MMGDKNNEIESDIPAVRITVTAIISARARKRSQHLIVGSQGRLGKWIMMGDKNNEGEATYQQFKDRQVSQHGRCRSSGTPRIWALSVRLARV